MRIPLAVIIILLISCQTTDKVKENADYFHSEVDVLHAKNIEENLIPRYSVEGMVDRKSISEMMQEYNIPGLSIAFVDDGKISWTKHYGYANLKDSTLVNSNTVFTGASLSKPITAMAALNLVEQGKLKLDQDVNLLLEEWKVPDNEYTQKEKVTLRRLISHNAGVKNDLWSSYMPDDSIPTMNQMLNGESPSLDPATSIVAEPGSTTFYSNPGYSIIQKLIMDVTDQSFEEAIDEMVFEPLSMESTTFEQPIPPELMKRKATGYTKDLEPYPYRVFPFQAAGGVWTTASDMAKMMITLLSDYHHGENMLTSQEMSQTIFRKEIDRYVFNLWNWGEDVVFHHYGSNQGFNCVMYGSIDKKQGMIAMTNSDNAFGFFDYLMRAVNQEYHWEYLQPEVWTPVEPDIRWTYNYLGEYEWRGNSVKLSSSNDQLYLTINEEKFKLVQTGDRVFILNEIPLKLTFPANEDDVRMTIWSSDDGPYRAEKMDD